MINSESCVFCCQPAIVETVSAENEKLKGIVKSQEEYIEALEKEEETVKMFQKPSYNLPTL